MYESLILGFAGGLTGTILGYLISLVLNKFTDWTTTVSMQALLTSIGFSMIVGLIFGVFPALRAAKSDPINALKAE
jgi:ABC-type antimicrobial peptide transport system permease subunit